MILICQNLNQDEKISKKYLNCFFKLIFLGQENDTPKSKNPKKGSVQDLKRALRLIPEKIRHFEFWEPKNLCYILTFHPFRLHSTRTCITVMRLIIQTVLNLWNILKMKCNNFISTERRPSMEIVVPRCTSRQQFALKVATQ